MKAVFLIRWISLIVFGFVAGSAQETRGQATVTFPVVQITTGRAETIEPSPTSRVAPAQFVLHRSGSTDNGLTVLMGYEGTARAGVDYTELPKTVMFPAGEAEVTLDVVAADDALVEGDETVVARLILPVTAFLPSYTIDPAANEAKVVIHDNDKEVRGATVKIVDPTDGAKLPAGSETKVVAVAVDPNGYIPRLEFYLDGELLGVSELTFIRAPDPGTPITHTVIWKSPAAGEHVLTARGKDTLGNVVTSDPVHVTVGGGTGGGATVEITSPKDGAELPAGVAVEVTAVAIDPQGYIPRLEFYLDEKLLDVSQIEFFRAPDPGTPITHRVTWKNPTVGTHVLTARGKDSKGNVVMSKPVHVTVRHGTGGGATVEITSPKDGAELSAGVPAEVTAVAIDPQGYIPRLEFYLDERVLDVSQIEFFRAPDPGTPITHTVTWKNPTPGTHVLTARGVDSEGNVVRSAAVKVTVGRQAAATVSIVTLDAEGTELPLTVLVIDPLRFEISRTGSTENALTVFFSLHGTTTPGSDYEEVSLTISIPAGEMSAVLTIVPKADLLKVLEPMETVGVRLEPSPAANPLVSYAINSAQAEAVGVIYEQRPPGTTVLDMVFPANGDRFEVGQPISLIAASYRPGGYLQHVDFYDGDKKIGSSDLAIDPNPEGKVPSLAFHHFVWKEAAAGEHKLNARATAADGSQIVSDAVSIVVNGELVSDARIDIISPKEGEVLPAGQEIPITAVAVDPQGYISRVEFYANDELVGVSDIKFIRAPDPGTPITHNVVWSDPRPGIYTLTARAAATDGSKVVSPPIHITVERKGTNPPKIAIVSPKDGSVFAVGSSIEIHVEPVAEIAAVPPVKVVAEIDILADGEMIASGKELTLSYVWKNAAPGRHNLLARALDSSGGMEESAPVRILVEDVKAASFVRRNLPGSYTPGDNLAVELQANPPAGTHAYGIEDEIPAGWEFVATRDGVFDATTRKVKYGPFLDGEARTLGYTVLAPKDAKGEAEFAGAGSADGISSVIGGDRLIGVLNSFHPADANQDQRLTLNEVTAYAAAWKSGRSWTVAPNPIPMTYVTRAGVLWHDGEVYRNDPGQSAPLCWMPNALVVTRLADSPEAVATQAAVQKGNGSEEVTVQIEPTSNTKAYAVEEKLPPSSVAENVGEDGVFDSASGTVRWGPFFDNLPRTLTCTVLGGDPIQGAVSFDGQLMNIGLDRPRITNLERGSGGPVRLNIQGPIGQVYLLESSSDLRSWTEEAPVFLPDGQLSYPANSAGEGSQRYYRLKTP